MKIPMSAFSSVIETLLRSMSKTATKYLDDKTVVRATRRSRPSRRDDYHVELVVSFGRPNYLDRQFIKACRKAGEPFPVRKIQLRFFPNKRS